jgi:hypothetical protein
MEFSKDVLISYRNKPKKKNTKKPFFLKRNIKPIFTPKTRIRITKIAKVLVVIALIVMGIQYAYMKYQISKYSIDDGYTCVHMSYEKEKFFEGIGFNVVQRRVEGVHRWVAIELWDGYYVDYESTLNFFGLHLVNEEMTGENIQQSEGFFKNGKEVVKVKTIWDMHTNLKDWKVIDKEGQNTNIEIFENLP